MREEIDRALIRQFDLLPVARKMVMEELANGHTNIKTTQIYAKITAQKISQDMETLSHKLEDMEKNICRAI